MKTFSKTLAAGRERSTQTPRETSPRRTGRLSENTPGPVGELYSGPRQRVSSKTRAPARKARRAAANGARAGDPVRRAAAARRSGNSSGARCKHGPQKRALRAAGASLPGGDLKGERIEGRKTCAEGAGPADRSLSPHAALSNSMDLPSRGSSWRTAGPPRAAWRQTPSRQTRSRYAAAVLCRRRAAAARSSQHWVCLPLRDWSKRT